MTASPESQAQEQKQSDKELNFRALEQKYKRELDQERQARLEAEKIAQEAVSRKQAPIDDDEDDSEPYVDHKRLNKKLAKFGQSTQSDIQKAMETAKQAAKEELKQEVWLESNPDFYDILQNHSEKLAQKSPALAKSILAMPNNFDRQRLVYQSIKELGFDKPEVKQQSIQEKVDANKRSPYYQPSGVGSAPYAQVGDYSKTGQKQAFDKMQELKNRLRLG